MAPRLVKINKPTQKRDKNAIDNFMVKNLAKFAAKVIHKECFSDHYPLSLTFFK